MTLRVPLKTLPPEALREYRKLAQRRCRAAKRARARRRADPTAMNATQRRSYWKHREKRLAEIAQWKRENRSAYLDGYKRWAAKNPTYFRDWQRKRRLRVKWLKWAATCAKSRRAAA